MGQSSIAIAGAGLTGAVLARELAEAGLGVTVFETRSHVAGNCHTARDPETGVLVHVYGPHIFHTDDAEVWSYVNRFGRFRPYSHRVMTVSRGQVFSLPVNLHTINQFFGGAHGPDSARALLQSKADQNMVAPENFEDMACSLMGPELYDAFFEGYTRKQWGIAPSKLPASILKRLPFRFSYDSNYFFHRFQGMPELGYTPIVERMLDHPRIDVHLGQGFRAADTPQYDHVFWSGPLDAFFGHSMGRLGYRTLDFERFVHTGDYQGCAVMNYADAEIPFTRITEHKHFSPWEEHGLSTCYREYSRDCMPGDTPYYPIRLTEEREVLSKYEAAARDLGNVSFVGRLGTYRYLDMDVCIRAALDCAQTFLDGTRRSTSNGAIPLKAVG